MGAYYPGYTPSEAELAYIRKSNDESSAFLAICGGFQPAMLAGVLAGKTATAPIGSRSAMFGMARSGPVARF
jgi:hypothetical protein